MHDLMATRQQLDGSLHSWRMQQHFPAVDENAKKMAEWRETIVRLADKSVVCEMEFNARLGETAQEQLSVSEAVAQTEVCPLISLRAFFLGFRDPPRLKILRAHMVRPLSGPAQLADYGHCSPVEWLP
jgi:hypothetical protein